MKVNRKGKKVLLIDGDPQGSLTIRLGNPQPGKLPVTLSDIMGKVLTDQPILTAVGGHRPSDSDSNFYLRLSVHPSI